jgi:hypothetical protein
LGIIALSIANLSTKSPDELEHPEDPFPKHKDLDWVKAYSEKRLQYLSADSNQLVSGGRGEKQYARDYSGRWLFEILQNIDDALGQGDSTRFIGTKGLGFLSVFELGEFVQIYSGNFNFEFSSVRTKDALIREGIRGEKAASAPKLFVPWLAKVDDVGLALKREGYATVIRIELFDGSEQKIEEEFRDLQTYFLLLSQNISGLKFESKNYKLSVDRALKSKKEKLSIEIQDIEINQISGESSGTTAHKKETYQWRRWSHDWDTGGNKRASCAICLPLQHGVPVPTETCLPIYNFYPTDEPSDIAALIHATFELSANRKNLQMHGEEKKWNSDRLDIRNFDLIENLSGLVNFLCHDSEITLENKLIIFKNIGRLKEEPKDTAAEKIRSSISKVMTTSRFVPTIFTNHFISIPEIMFAYSGLAKCFEKNQKLIKKDRENHQNHFNLLSENDNSLEKLFESYSDNQNFWAGHDFHELVTSRYINTEKADIRKLLFSMIGKYNKEEELQYSAIKDLPILQTEKSPLVRLSDIDVIFTKNLVVPAFLKPEFILTKNSMEDIRNFVEHADEGYHYRSTSAYKGINRKVVNDHDALISQLAETDEIVSNLQKKENFDIYEFIAYLFRFFNRNNKENFKKIGRNLVFNNEQNQGEGFSLDKFYFSKSWVRNEALQIWLIDTDKTRYRLPAKDFVTKKIEKFVKTKAPNKSKIDKKNKSESKKRDLNLLFLYLGVKEHPSLELVKKPLELREKNSLFREYDDQYWPRPPVYKYGRIYFVNDLKIYFKRASFKDRVKAVLSFFKDRFFDATDTGFGQRYKNFNHYNMEEHRKIRTERDKQIKNFLQYQIWNIEWIDVQPSIFHPSGKCKPGETFSTSKYACFPKIELGFLKKDEREHFYEYFGIKSLDDIGIEGFYSYLKKAETGCGDFCKRYPENFEVANVHLDHVWENFFASWDNLKPHQKSIWDRRIREEIKLPVVTRSKIFDFQYPSQILLNDLELTNRYAQDLTNITGKGICNLRTSIFRGNKPANLGSLSTLVTVRNDSTRFTEDESADFLAWLKERWEIFEAICDHQNGNFLTVLELQKKTCFCTKLSLTLMSKKDPEKLFTVSSPDVSNYFCQKEKKTFIAAATNLDDFWLYLKRQTGLSAALIESLFMAENEESLFQILRREELPENVVQRHYFLSNKLTFSAVESENESEDPELVDEISPVGDSHAMAQTKCIRGARSESGNQTQRGSTSSKHKSAPSRVSSGKPKPRGHIRASDDAGRSYVPAYDDESTENQKIGDKAEKYVVALLKDEGNEDARQMEANNKGYDIEYEENGVTKFVEVKGLRDSWDRADVMMSRSQFEKAQLEKENFSLYVVENVDSDGNEIRPSHTVIVNPASRFTKMQLDAGWKDFDNDSGDLKPKAGRYVSFREEPDKGRQKIIDVVANGRKIVLADDKKFIFQSNKMLIHNQPEDDD